MSEQLCRIPRLMIGAPGSGSGKTTLTCGLLQALINRRLRVASFKCGPDYIDPMFHSKVIGAKSRNLDLFFFSPQTARDLLVKNAVDCDVAIIEGVMGYYDGLGGSSATASSYHLARETQTPAVLVVNARGMSLSLAALLRGFQSFRPDSGIRGVIFNQVSPMGYPLLKKVVEEETGLKTYGFLPPLPDCSLESRHLGLVTADEVTGLKEKLERLAVQAEETLDLEGLLCLAQSAPALSRQCSEKKQVSPPVTVAVARDSAFCFYYEDSLALLRELGAKLVPFSPMEDSALPQGVSGLLLGGGYPELYAGRLAQNQGMRESIRQALANGMPCVAECGGFMYLHRFLRDQNGEEWPMVGAINGAAFSTGKLRRFGYVTLTSKKDGLLCASGESIPAHEFHYWDSTACGEDFSAQKPLRLTSWDCIHMTDTLFAGFPHIHFCGNPAFAKNFIRKCADFKGEDNHDLTGSN